MPNFDPVAKPRSWEEAGAASTVWDRARLRKRMGVQPAEADLLREAILAAGPVALRRQYTGAILGGITLGGCRVVCIEPATRGRGGTREFSAILEDGSARSLHFLIVSGALPPMGT